MTVGVVLTGGASRRMGRDKATLELDGVALALRVAAALSAGGCTTVELQGGDTETLGSLGLPVFADHAAGAGPVAAIADALGRHRGGAVVVAACDLPDLDGVSVAALVAAAGGAGRPAVATVDGRHQLVVVVPPSAADAWRAAADDDSTLRTVLDRLDAIEVPLAGSALRNLNTPDDLADRAQERIDDR